MLNYCLHSLRTFRKSYGKSWGIRIVNNDHAVTVVSPGHGFDNISDVGGTSVTYEFKGTELGAVFQSNGSNIWRVRSNYSLPIFSYDYTTNLIAPLDPLVSIKSAKDLLFDQYISSLNAQGLIRYEASVWEYSKNGGTDWYAIAGADNVKALYEAFSNTNAYTDAEQSKLAGLESSRFLGTYVDETALTTAHPTAPEGSYANVDGGVGMAAGGGFNYKFLR